MLLWVCGGVLAPAVLVSVTDGIAVRRCWRGARVIAACSGERCELVDRLELDEEQMSAYAEQGAAVYDVRVWLRERRRGVLFATHVVAEHRMMACRLGGLSMIERGHEALMRPAVANWASATGAVRGDARLLLRPDGYTTVRHLPWGYAANAGLLALAAGLVVGKRNMAAWREARRIVTAEEWIARGECPGCGYDIRGLMGGVCPECGASIVVSE